MSSSSSESTKGDNIIAERVIDISFLIIYTVALIALSLTTFKTFKVKANRTLQNSLTIVFIMATMLMRIGTIIYTLANGGKVEGDAFYSEDKYLDMFFYLELPFDFIIAASIVQFFQWLQFCFFLMQKEESDNGKEIDNTRFHIALLCAVVFSQTCLLLKFTSVILSMYYEGGIDVFRGVMDTILFVIYLVASFSFFPLFTVILHKFKQHYPEYYQTIKCKVIPLLCAYFFFVVLRLFLYVDFKILHYIFKNPTIYAVVPFYATEVIIAIFLSYVLFSVSRIERESENNLLEEEITRRLIQDLQLHMNGSNSNIGIINNSMRSLTRKTYTDNEQQNNNVLRDSLLAQQYLGSTQIDKTSFDYQFENETIEEDDDDQEIVYHQRNLSDDIYNQKVMAGLNNQEYPGEMPLLSPKSVPKESFLVKRNGGKNQRTNQHTSKDESQSSQAHHNSSRKLSSKKNSEIEAQQQLVKSSSQLSPLHHRISSSINQSSKII